MKHGKAKRKTNRIDRYLLLLALVACLTAAGIWGIRREAIRQTPGSTDSADLTERLVLSEICSKNESILADNQGRYRDYVEVYNSGEGINLQGYYLTDGRTQGEPFGSLLLPAESYRVLFLGKDVTGFALGASGGDCVQLVSPEGEVVAQADTVPLAEDQVMLRTAMGYTVSDNASPGFPNDSEGLQAFRKGREAENPVLRISEVLTENVSALPDEQGVFGDVVELYNSGSGPVYLGEYCLSDSLESRFRYRLPDVMLDAGAYVLVYCDGENYLGENGQIHANFALSRGETVCLTGRDGAYTVLPVQFPGDDVSLALGADGEYRAGAVSLGYSNSGSGIESFQYSRMAADAPLIISEVLLSSWDVPYQGAFTDVVEIWNRSDKPVNTAGWYLSDGQDPYTFALPEKELASGEYMLVTCSRAETGFALSDDDVVCLFTPQYCWASRVSCAAGLPGSSILHTQQELYTTGIPSPGYANTEAGEQAYEIWRRPQGLEISEVMTANSSFLKGAYGETSDWIELHNNSQETVNLAVYCLSDTANDLKKYPLPEKSLAPGEYCVLLLTNKPEMSRTGYGCLPFALSSQGETLYLSSDKGIADYVFIPELPTDGAYGRTDTGFSVLEKGTPGKANAGAAAYSVKPTAVTAQGMYDNVDSLLVELSGSGTIYYTTDCSVPTARSKVYTGPIQLTKTTVIRAVSYETGKKPSQIVDLTYILNGGHSLPAVSLVTAPDNLWDYHTGIYEKGPGADPEFPHVGANFWQPWEKRATVSLYEKEGGGFSAPCGLAIFGAYSRALNMKPFSCFFRDIYGAGELNYPLFGEEGLDSYEAFILRCGGQDFLKARVRDVLITSLVAEKTDVAVQKYRPVVLYLNGQFWGVYFIREKINEHYVAGNYNISADEVDLCVANGYENPAYKEFMTYVKSHDLSVQEHYDYVCSQMDIVGYMDYILAEIYIANFDNGNIKYFKTPEGKWTWILYDMDYGFGEAGLNTFKTHLNPGGTGHGNFFSTALINALLKNPTFKEAFLRRLAWQLDNIWSVENVYAHIDQLESLLETDMQKDEVRWYRHNGNWESHMDSLRRFVVARNKNIVGYAQDYFDLSNDQMREYGFDR